MPNIPGNPKFQSWPAHSIAVAPEDIHAMYKAGYAGAFSDPDERERLKASVQWPDGAQAAYEFGLVGSGAGKLSIPFIFAYKHWPNCWPSPAQTTGDCVSHAGKNCGVVLIGVECELAQPDEVTGKVEGWPEVSDVAEKNGVVACEPIYGDRGWSGQGANCDRLITHVTKWGGIMLRKEYPELNLDLTKYNASIGIRWGSSQTPENVRAEGRKHQIRTATACDNHEVCRDFVANGYPIWVCSSLGWSESRDENGYSRQSGGWAHSWVVDGYDDRPDTVKKYGFPLFHFNHDWGKWNGGGRRIMGTEIDIPEGSFWADARLLNRCECTAMSSIDGWDRRNLPDFGATGVI